MPYLNVASPNSPETKIYYEDHGSGVPVVLIHGWPLSSASWEKQVPALLAAGYRVIAYDRRGFGRSDQSSTGYDFDTLASDLDRLMTGLDLRDATLVGFSMGGGEVARYLGKFGSQGRVCRAAFVSAITPFLLKTDENPSGVERNVFEGMKEKIVADRPQFLEGFFKDFYGIGKIKGSIVSAPVEHLSWMIASGASPIGTLASIDSWLEDFRADLSQVEIPVLVVHGDSDQTIPFASSAELMSTVIPHSQLYKIESAPHGLNWTHATELNTALLTFLETRSVAKDDSEYPGLTRKDRTTGAREQYS